MNSYNAVPPPHQVARPAVQSIQADEEYLTRLHALTSPIKELIKGGYRLTQLTEGELAAKTRCANCTKNIKPPRERLGFQEAQRIKYGASPMGQDRAPGFNAFATPSTPQATPSASQATPSPSSNPQSKRNEPKPICIYHPGRFDRHTRTLTCCRKNGAAQGCVQEQAHTPINYRPGELRDQWTFHPTSKSYNSPNHRAAVAIDCEMGTASSGDTELIRVSMVDHFSGQTLIDSLVWPDVQMAHFNTRFSGVTRDAMNDARRTGRCFFGVGQARMECQKFVGPRTIIIGHGAQNDLGSLRWAHDLVIDTYLIESKRIKIEEGEAAAAEELKAENVMDDGAEDVLVPGPAVPAEKKKKTPKGMGRLALKTLTRERLGRDIQTKEQLGHDSLEDALAARDLAHWFVVNTVFTDAEEQAEALAAD